MLYNTKLGLCPIKYIYMVPPGNMDGLGSSHVVLRVDLTKILESFKKPQTSVTHVTGKS
jgi:hypothetical protein